MAPPGQGALERAPEATRHDPGPCRVLLGCIADDFTGATDLASMLVRHGMATVQLIGVPADGVDAGDAQAVVVALKSRTIPADRGDRASRSPRSRGCARGARGRSCSNTARPSIPPSAATSARSARRCSRRSAPISRSPARRCRRTAAAIYQGHLFVGEQLLSDSHMRHHPLTPMTDSNLVRVLQRQSKAPVGLVPYPGGRARARRRSGRASTSCAAQGVRQAIADAVSERHLLALGAAAADLPLITGGSGIAMGLPENFRRARPARGRRTCRRACRTSPGSRRSSPAAARRRRSARSSATAPPAGRRSCSTRSALADGGDDVARALAFAEQHLGDGPVLISSSAPPEEVAKVQERLGRERAGAAVEDAMAAIAQGLVDQGVRRLVVAGGETAGAVVGALGVEGAAHRPADRSRACPGPPASASRRLRWR